MEDVVKLIALKIGSDYGILSDQLFQLDPAVIVNITQDNGNTIIALKENPDYIQNFFGKTVGNISGIVGKNGVGKSTTLRYIKELFYKDIYSAHANRNDVVIFRDNDTINCYLNKNAIGRYEIRNSTKYQCIHSYYVKTPKLYDSLKSNTTIYYSNSLDEEKKEIEPTNFYNISTNFLKDNIGKINKNLRNKKIRNQGGYKRFKITDLIRQIKLLTDVSGELRGLTIPFKNISNIRVDVLDIRPNDYEQIKSAIKKINSDNFPDNERIEIEKKLISKIENIESLFKYEKKVNSFEQNIHSNVFENYIIYLLKTLFKEVHGDIILLSKHNFLSEILSRISEARLDRRSIRDELVTLPKIIADELKNSTKAFNIQGTLGDIQASSKLVIKFFDLLYRGEPSVKSFIINALNSDFLIFLESYIAVNSEFNFINFRWQELSAGEMSLMSFFSRLYSISKDIKTSNVLLLIDEGDLYFHPEWQRDYLFYLIQFFEVAFPNIKNVSVILTTHSPFILSDLPSENVILLRKDDHQEKSVIVESGDLHLQTFGGNIHTLFTTAFFMGDTTVSKFARDKIQKEIIEMIGQHYSNIDFRGIKKLIEKIGEPVLKSSLLELLEKKYGSIR